MKAEHLTVALFLLGGIFTIVGWLMNRAIARQDKRMEEFDKHMKECNARQSGTAVMEQRLGAIEHQFKDIRAALHWLGDCTMMIGSKMDAKLPDRPGPTQ